MTVIKLDVNHSTEWHGETLNGVFPVPMELVQRTYRGETIGQLSEVLYPEADLLAHLKPIAEFWVKTSAQRGRELTHAFGDIRLWGPYLHRDWGGAGRASQMRAVGWSEAEILDSGLYDCILQAEFKNPHVREIES